MSDVEIAWLAGILEGEGSFLFWKARDSRYGTRNNVVRIQMSTSDRDILERVANLVGVGTVRTLPYHPDRLGKKPMWIWSIQAKADVRELALRVRPWLGERRTQQANVIIAATEGLIIRPNGKCRKGHVIDEENRRWVGWGWTCRICDNARRRERAKIRRAQRDIAQ